MNKPFPFISEESFSTARKVPGYFDMKSLFRSVRVIVTILLASGLLAIKTSGQVLTLQNWTNLYHGTLVTAQSVPYPVATGSNTDRVLVVAIASDRASIGQVSVTALTYGGQPLTMASGDMGSNIRQHTALYYLDNAGLQAATSNILAFSISVLSGSTTGRTDIWAAVFDYVNQTTPLTDSRNYNSGTSTVTSFQFSAPLTINAFNQAVEVVSSHRAARNSACTITYATSWTTVNEQTSFFNVGATYYSIRNGIANRSIPTTSAADPSLTRLSNAALASMTALSLNYQPPPPPTIQASNITFTDVTSSSFTINWTSGNGSNRLVVIKAGSPVDNDPVNGTTYAASNIFGNGSQIGTGNYVVYNGNGFNVSVDNLDGSTTYYVAIYEFSGPPGLEFYLKPPATASQATEPETANTGDYRSNGSGNWATPATWQTYNGTSWVTATSPPNSSNGVITIRDSHTVTVDAAVTVDQVVIKVGGQVTVSTGINWTIADGADTVDCTVDGNLFNEGTVTTTGVLSFSSGSTYQHAENGGTIPTATWDANSNCVISGITSTAPSGFGQSFGNFTWNCPSQTLIAVMNSDVTVQGTFSLINTNTGGLSILDGNVSKALTILGDYYQTGGTFDLNRGTKITTASLKVAGNFYFTGGTITESAPGLSSIIFDGSGLMQTFTSGGTFTNNNVNFIVNSGAYLQMGTGSNPSYISNSKGIFTLSSGATLGITDHYGITLTTTGSTGGNIRVTGTRTYNSGANYIYNGSVAQITNVGLPSTINRLIFDNSGGAVTFNSARTMTAEFSITSGSKATLNGFTHTTAFLTLGGIGQQGGSYGGNGSGATNIVPAYFTDGPGIVNNTPPMGIWLGITTDWNTASNWVGGVPAAGTNGLVNSFPVNQPLISGTTSAACNTLTLFKGASLTIDPGGQATISTMVNNGTINLNSSSSSIFSLLMGSYSGSGTANAQIFLTGGGDPNFNWHYIAVPQTMDKSVLTTYGDDLLRYDNSLVTTSDFQGWEWHDGYIGEGITNGISFSTLEFERGYNFYNDFDVTPIFSVTSLATDLPTVNLQYEGSGSNAIRGFNLLGNSLTCSLNWDNVTFSGSVGQTVYFTSANKWISYLKGAGGTNTATNYIPPLQGFFVKADGTGASISFPSAAKVHSTQTRYKGIEGEEEAAKDQVNYPKIKLELNNGSTSDETIIWFNENATTRYDRKYDGFKLFSSVADFGQLYSILGGRNYVINGIKLPADSITVPLGIKIIKAGKYSLLRKDLVEPDGYEVLLIDKTGNYKVNLKNNDSYSFSTEAGTITDRFLIKIVSIAAVDKKTVTNNSFSIYSSKGLINILPPDDINEGSEGFVKVYDMTGRIRYEVNNIEWYKGSLVQIPFTEKQGIYIVEVASGLLNQRCKVFIH